MKNSITCLLALVAIGLTQALPIQITVETSPGNTIDLEMEPTATIRQLKQEINKKERVLSGLEQRLYFGAKELSSGDRQLQAYGIEAGSVLVQSLHAKKRSLKKMVGKTLRSILSCGSMKDDPDLDECVESPSPKTSIQLLVKTSNGTRISLEIEPTESIARLKQAIENSTKVSADDQRLFLDEGSVLNEDDRTLDSYGISKDSIILQVFHPQNALDVAIETSSGHVFTGVFQASDTIADVKREIGKRGGIPFDQQVLSLVSGNQTQTLDDEGRTLESYGIESGSSIAQTYLPKADLRIAVETSTGHSFVVNVERSDQVELIKREIEKRDRRIPFDKQRLVFAGEQLENDRTLGSYNINTSSRLLQSLKTGIQIMIQSSSGNKWTLDVDPTQLVDQVKAEIKRREKIPAARQRLMFDGKTLEPGTPLDKYNISAGDIVQQTLHDDAPITVFIKTSKGSFYGHKFKPNETVLQVKRLILTRDAIPVADQIISLNGKVLRDDKTLEYYDVKTRTTLMQRKRDKEIKLGQDLSWLIKKS